MIVYVRQDLLPAFSHLLNKEYDLNRNMIFGSLGIAEDGSTIGNGVIVASMAEDSLNIEWICVDKNMRRQGIGQEILREFIDKAKRMHSINFIMSIFTQNEVLKRMLVKEGFVFEEDVFAQYSHSVKELKPMDDKMKDIPGYTIISTEDVTDKQLRVFSQFIYENEVKGGIQLPIKICNYNCPSAFVIDEDMNICGAFLTEIFENEIYISWIYCNPKHPKAFYMLLANVVDGIINEFQEDTRISFTVTNSAAENLSKYFFSNSKPVKIEYGELFLV